MRDTSPNHTRSAAKRSREAGDDNDNRRKTYVGHTEAAEGEEDDAEKDDADNDDVDEDDEDDEDDEQEEEGNSEEHEDGDDYEEP